MKNPAEVKRVNERPGTLVVDVIAGADGEITLYEDSGDMNDYDTRHAFTRISQKSDGRNMVMEISPRSGFYDGMLEKRANTVNVFNAVIPREVRLNGKIVPFSETDCTLTVSIPSLPTDEKIELNFEF